MPESWKKTLQSAYVNHRIITAVNREKQVNWLIVELGLADVASERINKELDRMLIGFNRLCKYKSVKQASLGYFRMLDIVSGENVCHPTIHILLPTIKSYFQGRYYIKAESWLALWCKAMDMDSTDNVTVNVKVVSAKGEQQTVIRKMDQGLSRLVEDTGRRRQIQNESSIHLASRRLIGYSRMMKEYMERLNPAVVVDINQYDTEDTIANAVFEIMLDWYPGIRHENERIHPFINGI
ncbi:protein rep [Paenibacillus alvei]|uniref:protein rep n=1 Tax=Paenibacillus alvei TaxID=44250 RepID=UPI0002886CBE|nr:protein rep [Paenibacillus alvei]EJW20005.1 protein Rep [Paenibacillus alvei DSM 29]MCY9543408.1 protein rep [Paenibacillus alvei]MCY9707605.1 protein rep [Paenibacillus alvei]MCY9733735.1 protein rep [Paenibacillus alvei]MCY9755474.1 protein rep [Paenibacillus alvei]